VPFFTRALALFRSELLARRLHSPPIELSSLRSPAAAGVLQSEKYLRFLDLFCRNTT
jgi:hypothetical protein